METSSESISYLQVICCGDELREYLLFAGYLLWRRAPRVSLICRLFAVENTNGVSNMLGSFQLNARHLYVTQCSYVCYIPGHCEPLRGGGGQA